MRLVMQHFSNALNQEFEAELLWHCSSWFKEHFYVTVIKIIVRTLQRTIDCIVNLSKCSSFLCTELYFHQSWCIRTPLPACFQQSHHTWSMPDEYCFVAGNSCEGKVSADQSMAEVSPGKLRNQYSFSVEIISPSSFLRWLSGSRRY